MNTPGNTQVRTGEEVGRWSLPDVKFYASVDSYDVSISSPCETLFVDYLKCSWNRSDGLKIPSAHVRGVA